MKFILDTNFLIDIIKFKIDIFEEAYGYVTVSNVFEELKKFAKKRTKEGMNARLALKLIEINNVKVMESNRKTTDEALLFYAKVLNYGIATNDKKLIEKANAKNMPILRIKQRKNLITE